jgi:hypothetical protein
MPRYRRSFGRAFHKLRYAQDHASFALQIQGSSGEAGHDSVSVVPSNNSFHIRKAKNLKIDMVSISQAHCYWALIYIPRV